MGRQVRQDELFYVKLGKRIRFARQHRGLMPKQLGEQLRPPLSSQHILQVERGYRRPLVHQLCQICEILGVTVGTMLTGLPD